MGILLERTNKSGARGWQFVRKEASQGRWLEQAAGMETCQNVVTFFYQHASAVARNHDGATGLRYSVTKFAAANDLNQPIIPANPARTTTARAINATAESLFSFFIH
ncbi:hypothetical protein G7048_19000 [Diaphorobacter sp. HDW4B]|uniref:hypothetical protein n=1 Tax=Diaphorobacter sp. HDW4B TaxID=2714925 RepID=UPI00140AD5D4|nr:hypothetical protein [Diaphorobacter sp. HDW4B]QIL72256.1 hypothetical protein G7048_19000 [Diaphorobacter sp. HDW4B]